LEAEIQRLEELLESRDTDLSTSSQAPSPLIGTTSSQAPSPLIGTTSSQAPSPLIGAKEEFRNPLFIPSEELLDLRSDAGAVREKALHLQASVSRECALRTLQEKAPKEGSRLDVSSLIRKEERERLLLASKTAWASLKSSLAASLEKKAAAQEDLERATGSGVREAKSRLAEAEIEVLEGRVQDAGADLEHHEASMEDARSILGGFEEESKPDAHGDVEVSVEQHTKIIEAKKEWKRALTRLRDAVKKEKQGQKSGTGSEKRLND